jgi:hypothetical protein
MANAIDGTYDSGVLGATVYIRLRAAEGAVYVAGGASADFQLHAFNGASRRRFGIHARGARLSRIDGGVVKRTFLPYGTQAALDALALESNITIGGIVWKVKGKVPESSV